MLGCTCPWSAFFQSRSLGLSNLKSRQAPEMAAQRAPSFVAQTIDGRPISGVASTLSCSYSFKSTYTSITQGTRRRNTSAVPRNSSFSRTTVSCVAPDNYDRPVSGVASTLSRSSSLKPTSRTVTDGQNRRSTSLTSRNPSFSRSTAASRARSVLGDNVPPALPKAAARPALLTPNSRSGWSCRRIQKQDVVHQGRS